jgi:hypothetical protein
MDIQFRKCRALLLAMSECLNPEDLPMVAWRCKRSSTRVYACEVSGEIINSATPDDPCVECGIIRFQCDSCQINKTKHKRGTPQPVFSGACIKCSKSLNVCDICVKKIYTLKGKNVADYYTCVICEECICEDHADELRCTNCQTPIHACADDERHTDDDDVDAMRCRRCKFKQYQHSKWN